jgi:hypothetical protein
VADAIEAKDLKAMLQDSSMKETIAEKLKDYVENFDMTNLDEDTLEEMDKVIFSPERVEECLNQNIEKVNDAVMEKLETFLDSGDTYYDHPIVKAISESKPFQAAIDRAVTELIENSSKLDKLVEKIAFELLSEGNSGLRTQLTIAISEQLTDKIASSFIDRMVK